MNFDAVWLMDLLDGAPGADELADKLTACGFLVELRSAGEGGEIWDVEVTTNRPDAMNHRGLAREAAVATGATLRPLTFELEEGFESAADLAAVEIADPSMCTRFCARVIRGVARAASPDWMQRRLRNAGVRPISAIVDVTNYVLLELGQPLHAYDLARVGGARLVARRAEAGETLVTLDGETRTLEAGMPVIADAYDVVGLAGIMGGADSEIGADTVDVLLEAATFDALTTRRAARSLGMHTEASHRFERGADPEMPPVAVDYAAALIAELTGGVVCSGRIDVRPHPNQPLRLRTTASRVGAFMGLEVAVDRMAEIAEGLGLVPEIDGDALTVTVPSWRVDLEREADLMEEFVRHIGFDAVPSELPVLSTKPGHRHPNWELIDRAREAAVRVGLAEVITWSFIDPGSDAGIDDHPLCPGPSVPLDNPLATTQAVMRRSLLPGLLGAVRDNLNQGERAIAVFEQGRVFARDTDGPIEAERLSAALAGSRRDGDEPVGFGDLKGVVDGLADRLALAPLVWNRGGAPWLDETQGALVTTGDGTAVGLAGLVAPELARAWEIKAPVYIAELDLSSAPAELALPEFTELPRHPSVTADMTIEHPVALSYAELTETVRALAGDLVESIDLRARYTGTTLPPDTVRTTIRTTYRAGDRSLTQDEVNEQQQALRGELARRLDVTFA
jgi:phenylalanyl-tRNA synthetase beta chain